MLRDELAYFIANQEELVAQFSGKVLVIKEQKVIGVFNTPIEAYLETQKNHELGTFMIQRCESGVGAYTATISTVGICA